LGERSTDRFEGGLGDVVIVLTRGRDVQGDPSVLGQ
jgi:hypothetical protein